MFGNNQFYYVLSDKRKGEEMTKEEKSAIDKGLADIKAGRIKPHKEARKMYAKWR